MIIFKAVEALQKHLQWERAAGKSIGFVPTMGALHAGHLSLVRQAKQHADVTIASIFVNPTQFNDPKDYEKYPVTISQDIRLLEQEHADILFLPGVEEVYPSGLQAPRHYDLGFLETVLEGAYRPGHFQGVCQVVHRLLDIVAPDQMWLGQKDYQQCMVLKHMVTALRLPLEIRIAPTVREKSGLAMSSRNMRLSEAEQQQAVAIYESLNDINRGLSTCSFGELQTKAMHRLQESGFHKIDYVAIVDRDTLDAPPQERWDGRQPMVALIAAFIGDVRLIDNMVLH